MQIGVGKAVKIYKNPYVSYDSYFVKTGKAYTRKMEASASKGFCINNMNGNWEIQEVQYYDSALRNEFPVVAENRVAIQKIIDEAVLNAVLKLVGER
jgi:hypothetical protein